jgi:general secretion pathway protein I
MKRTSGFTLIEVLVALVIVAVGMMAIWRSSSQLLTSQESLNKKYLADQSAYSEAQKIRYQRLFEAVNVERSFDCSQAQWRFECVVLYQSTPNPFFRKVKITVREQDPLQPQDVVAFRVLTELEFILAKDMPL